MTPLSTELSLLVERLRSPITFEDDYKEAAATIIAMAKALEVAREGLENIAQQKLISEMDEPDGDYEGAYEQMVSVARQALARIAALEKGK